jgi:hypothetical protein
LTTAEVVGGLPLALLAAFLGLRVIAGELDGRSLEIAYTVPGGAERVWRTQLAASALVILASEGLLAAATFLFFAPEVLYVALQAALFYLVLAMADGKAVRLPARKTRMTRKAS